MYGCKCLVKLMFVFFVVKKYLSIVWVKKILYIRFMFILEDSDIWKF